MSDVRNEAGRQRYELTTDGVTAIASYRREGDAVVMTHTEVPEAAEGQGIGTRLIAGALADIRAHGLRVVPACPFVADYLDRHPEDRDLLAEAPRR